MKHEVHEGKKSHESALFVAEHCYFELFLPVGFSCFYLLAVLIILPAFEIYPVRRANRIGGIIKSTEPAMKTLDEIKQILQTQKPQLFDDPLDE